jgi:HK97 family phage prohead protease
MELEKKTIKVELKEDSEPGSFTAVIATLNVCDKDGDVTLPGAFPDGKQVLISAYGHTSWLGKPPIGVATIHEKGDKVLGEGRFNLMTTDGKDTYEALKFAPQLQEFSYGFYPTEWSVEEWEDDGEARMLKKIDIKEMSPVLVGAGIDTGLVSIKSGEETKPYENEHACRLRSPSDFDKDTFRRVKRKHEGKEYSVIMGKLKGEDTMTEQAYRYDKKVWSESEARSHCKDKDGSFEAAKKAEGMTYVEEAEMVLAAVNDLSARTKSLADLRREDGRDLSLPNRERLEELQESLNGIGGYIKELIEAPAPKANPGRELEQLELQFLELESKFVEVTK